MRWRGSQRIVYVGTLWGAETTKGMRALVQTQVGLRLGLVAVVLVTTLVTATFGGPTGVYLGLIAGILSLILCFDGTMLKLALKDWGVRCFLASFLLLELAFVLSARDIGDAMAFVDFLAFPIVVPLFALVARYGGPHRTIAFTALAAVGCVAALAHGLYEVKVLGSGRAQGNTSAIFFSDLSVLLGAFALWGLVVVEKWSRWLFVAAFAAAMGAAALGGTRGSIITAGAVFLVFAVYLAWIWPRPLRVKLAVIGGTLALALAALFLLFDLSRMMSTFGAAAEVASTQTTSDVSVTIRLMLYNAAVHSFMDAPIFGHGWWQRFAAAMPYMTGVDSSLALDKTQHLHNDMLNFASAAGIIGVVAYLILMAGPVVSACTSIKDDDRPLRIAIAASLSVGYVAMGLTDTMFVFETPKSIYVLSAAIVTAFFVTPPQIEKTT